MGKLRPWRRRGGCVEHAVARTCGSGYHRGNRDGCRLRNEPNRAGERCQFHPELGVFGGSDFAGVDFAGVDF